MIAENCPHKCAVHLQCKGYTGSDFRGIDKNQIRKIAVMRGTTGESLHTIGGFNVRSQLDLDFDVWDYYTKNGVDYSYYCIPIMEGEIVGVGETVDVSSQFDDLFIGNLIEQYVCAINAEYTHEKQFSRAFVQTYYSKYPNAVVNGNQMFNTGSVSGVFLEFDESACRFKTETAGEYKRKYISFLGDPEPKVVKTRDGNIWTVQSNGRVVETFNRAYAGAKISFEWTEVDDPPTYGVVAVRYDGLPFTLIDKGYWNTLGM